MYKTYYILTIDPIDIKLLIAVFLFFGIYIYILVYRYFFLKNILCCIERKPRSPKGKRTHELIWNNWDKSACLNYEQITKIFFKSIICTLLFKRIFFYVSAINAKLQNRFPLGCSKLILRLTLPVRVGSGEIGLKIYPLTQ